MNRVVRQMGLEGAALSLTSWEKCGWGGREHRFLGCILNRFWANLNRFTQKQDPRWGCDYKWFTQDLIQGGECGSEAGWPECFLEPVTAWAPSSWGVLEESREHNSERRWHIYSSNSHPILAGELPLETSTLGHFQLILGMGQASSCGQEKTLRKYRCLKQQPPAYRGERRRGEVGHTHHLLHPSHRQPWATSGFPGRAPSLNPTTWPKADQA